jgi:hypothetical protein
MQRRASSAFGFGFESKALTTCSSAIPSHARSRVMSDSEYDSDLESEEDQTQYTCENVRLERVNSSSAFE